MKRRPRSSPHRPGRGPPSLRASARTRFFHLPRGRPVMPPISFTVNGKRETVNVTPDTPLLWVLRDTLGLTGTKFGYCQSGQIMAAAALLAKNPHPTDADIDTAMTNICRCGTYQRIRAAIHRAAQGA